MALDGLNAAAAAAILNNAGVDDETRTRGVILSAFVPGPLGLAVPLILAQQNPAQGGLGGVPALPAPNDVVVPDVLNEPVDDAMAALMKDRLVPVQRSTYSDANAGTVVKQEPEVDTIVSLGSRVTVWVSAGPPPAGDVPPGDIDADLTDKINAAEEKLEGKIDDVNTALENKIDNVNITLAKIITKLDDIQTRPPG